MEIGYYAFRHCASLTSVTIPNSVMQLGGGAFYECSKLNTVTIGNSVWAIEEDTFLDCPQLIEINSLSTTPPRCNEEAFDNDAFARCVLNIPKGSLKAYQSAEYWKNFQNVKESIDPAGVDNPIDDSGITIVTKGDRITVNGADNDSPVEIYNVAGQLIYGGTDTTISVPASGLYIVKVAGQTFKIIL